LRADSREHLGTDHARDFSLGVNRPTQVTITGVRLCYPKELGWLKVELEHLVLERTVEPMAEICLVGIPNRFVELGAEGRKGGKTERLMNEDGSRVLGRII
jgi:hypothetical protein